MKKIYINKKSDKNDRPYFVLTDNETSSLRVKIKNNLEGSEGSLLARYEELNKTLFNSETDYLHKIKENSVKYGK